MAAEMTHRAMDWENDVRAEAEGYFREKLPPGKLFTVAATFRDSYVEVMVFIANIKDEPSLYQDAKQWARDLRDKLDADGYPVVIYVQTYTPPVRRLP